MTVLLKLYVDVSLVGKKLLAGAGWLSNQILKRMWFRLFVIIRTQNFLEERVLINDH